MGIQYFDSVNLLSQFVDSVGDGSGITNLNGNYTAGGDGLTTFKYSAPTGMVAHIDGVTVVMEGPGTFAYDEYVPGDSLDVGVKFEHDTAATIRQIPQDFPIKVLAQYAIIGGGDITDFQQGNALNFATFEMSFLKLHEKTLDLNGTNNEEFRVILNDTFAGLTLHSFLVHGHLTKVDA